MINKEKTYALSLSGGGFKGAYQAGVIMGLHDEGVKFSGVCGTSIGALNGGLVVSNNFKTLYDLWHDFELSDVFDVDNEELERALKMDLDDVSIFDIGKGMLDLAHQNGIDIQPLVNMINSNVDEQALREEGAVFGLVTINLTDKRIEEIMLSDMPQGTLPDYLVATAYLPVFKKIKLHGKYYLDGGFYNNTPTNMLADRGYEDIIEIRLKTGHSYEDYGANVIRFIPEKDLGRTIIYNKEVIDRNYQMGYNHAIRMCRNVHGFDYIIEGDESEMYFMQKLLSLDVRKLYRFGIDYKKYKTVSRPILEDFGYFVYREFRMRKNYSYADVYIKLLEYIARICMVDDREIYTVEALEQLVLEKSKKYEDVLKEDVFYPVLMSMIK